MSRIIALWILLLAFHSVAWAQQPVNSWSNAFAPPGVTGHYVAALAKSDNRIYVAGDYSIAGHEATRFGAYDLINEEWISIAEFEWGTLQALATDDQGIVYVGGSFQEIGGISASNVAWYNPHTDEWGTLGAGFNNTVSKLAISPAGELYAVGAFVTSGRADVRYLARWNGESWVSVANIDSAVRDIAFEDEFIYVGGHFSMINEIEAKRIARLDTTTMTWSAVGGGVGQVDYGYVTRIELNEEGIFVGGDFDDVIQPDGSSIYVNNIARWDRLIKQWYPLGEGTGQIQAMALGPDGALYVPGSGGVLRRWDGSEWHPIVIQENKYNLRRSVRTVFATTEHLIVGFQLILADTERLYQALYWYDPFEDDWGVYGNEDTNGLTASLYALEPGPIPGTVYAGGYFNHAGIEEVNHVAFWDGKSWKPLGGGVQLASVLVSPTVNALHYASNGMLYVGGSFDWVVQMDGTVLHSQNIAAWDPVSGTWHPLGQGAGQPVETFAEPTDGQLYVGGRFMEVIQSGGDIVGAYRIALWNIVEWQWEVTPETHGFDNVTAMTSDESGTLFVAGRNGLTGRIARFIPHSEEWEEIRTWPGSPVNDIEVFGSPPDNGVLFAALNIGGVWQWDNSIWSQLGEFEPALSLAVNGDPFNGGELYAAGWPSGPPWASIRRLQGSTWYELAEGLENNDDMMVLVSSLAIGSSEMPDQAAVWIGGDFTMSGGIPSVGIARWEAIRHGPVNVEPLPFEQGITIQIYPNPTIDHLTVAYELGSATSARMVLYDLLGRELTVLHDGFLAAGSGTLTSDVKHLPSGTYIVRIMTGDDNTDGSVQRFTVVR